MAPAHPEAIYLGISQDLSTLRYDITAALGNLFWMGLTSIGLLALLHRKAKVGLEVLVLGVIVAIIVFDPGILGLIAEIIGALFSPVNPISTPPGG